MRSWGEGELIHTPLKAHKAASSPFSPAYQTADDRHQLDFQGDTQDLLVQKMVSRLGRAIASEEIREKMDVEDELDRIFEREMNKLAAEKDGVIAEKEGIIAEKEGIIAGQQLQLSEERRRAEEERKRAEEERERAEAEIRKNIELQQQIEALKKQIRP